MVGALQQPVHQDPLRAVQPGGVPLHPPQQALQTRLGLGLQVGLQRQGGGHGRWRLGSSACLDLES